MKRTLILLAAGSIALNVVLWMRRPSPFITAPNANSRPTFLTMHNIGEAQKHATGRGVKIGILDHYFAFDGQRALYAGGADFVGDAASLRKIGEHGLWLARTAKEVAPGAEIYALNVVASDEETTAQAMVKAMVWASAHGIDVLTYSQPAFSPKVRPRIDAAVAAATAAGVNCVFLHYSHPANLMPFGMLPLTAEPGYERPPDINVYHYDYNVLLVRDYEKSARGERGTPPYLSLSSTPVIAGGVVAMLREVRRGLPPAEYKRILIATSRPYAGKAPAGPEVVRACPRMLDALAAVLSVEPAGRRAQRL